jgi:hypothetical protein
VSLRDRARQVAGAASTVGAVISIMASVEGRPIKEKDKPARVKVLGLPVFERLESGKQYVLWFRIRDVRR